MATIAAAFCFAREAIACDVPPFDSQEIKCSGRGCARHASAIISTAMWSSIATAMLNWRSVFSVLSAVKTEGWRRAADAALNALDERVALWDAVESAVAASLTPESKKRVDDARQRYQEPLNAHVPSEDELKKKDGFVALVITSSPLSFVVLLPF